MVAGAMATVLAVDDDVRNLRLIKRCLEPAGFQVQAASDGEEAVNAVRAHTPDLILLDVLMPKFDGFAVCEQVRAFSKVPIIVVTGVGADDDKVRGLDLGADDYLTKPFSPRELVARVKAVLRRASREEAGLPQPAYEYEGLVVDFEKNIMTMGGTELALTRTEHKLLLLFARNAGRVLTPDQILERVWGQEYVGESHLLRVTMGRLRQKLNDDPREPRFIQTRPGIGYCLVKPEELVGAHAAVA